MKKETILYIHGFNSGPGEKAKTLQKHLPDYNIIAPQLSDTEIKRNLQNLCKIVDHIEDMHIVGTSLGGFYTLLLNKIYKERYDLSFYPINPSLSPSKSLKSKLGKKLKNYKTGNEYEISSNYIEELKKLEETYNLLDDPEELIGLYVYLGNKDEILDFTELESKIKKFDKPYSIVRENQDHRFSNLDLVIKQIKENWII